MYWRKVFHTYGRVQFSRLYYDLTLGMSPEFLGDPDDIPLITAVGTRWKSRVADTVFKTLLDQYRGIDFIYGQGQSHMFLEDEPRQACGQLLTIEGTAFNDRIPVRLAFTNDPDMFPSFNYDCHAFNGDNPSDQRMNKEREQISHMSRLFHLSAEQDAKAKGGLIFCSTFLTQQSSLSITLGGDRNGLYRRHAICVHSRKLKSSPRFQRVWKRLDVYTSPEVSCEGMNLDY